MCLEIQVYKAVSGRRSIPLNSPVYLCKLFEFHFYLPTLCVFVLSLALTLSTLCCARLALHFILQKLLPYSLVRSHPSSFRTYLLMWLYKHLIIYQIVYRTMISFFFTLVASRWVLVKPECFYPMLSFISFYFHTVSSCHIFHIL